MKYMKMCMKCFFFIAALGFAEGSCNVDGDCEVIEIEEGGSQTLDKHCTADEITITTNPDGSTTIKAKGYECTEKTIEGPQTIKKYNTEVGGEITVNADEIAEILN